MKSMKTWLLKLLEVVVLLAVSIYVWIFAEIADRDADFSESNRLWTLVIPSAIIVYGPISHVLRSLLGKNNVSWKWTLTWSIVGVAYFEVFGFFGASNSFGLILIIGIALLLAFALSWIKKVEADDQ